MKRLFILLMTAWLCTGIAHAQDYASLDIDVNSDMLYTVSYEIESDTNRELKSKDVAIEHIETKKFALKNYPNPSKTLTIINLPKITNQVNLVVTAMDEKVVFQSTIETLENKMSIPLEVGGLTNGYYVYTVIDEQNGNAYQGKLLKK
jgi:hypothetical protein